MAEHALFKEIYATLQDEEYIKVVELCNKAHSKLSKDHDVIKIKCIALIRLEKFIKALEIAKRYDFLQAEKAYCLYRLRKDEAALLTVNSCSDAQKLSPVLLHIKAQVEYRRENFQMSREIYQSFQEDVNMDEEEEVSPLELHTNFLAALACEGITSPCQRPSKYDNLEQSHYEVAYNKSFGRICNKDWEDATILLARAEKLWREALVDDGVSDVQMQNELAFLQAQRGFVRYMSGDKEEALTIYQNVLNTTKPLAQAIATNNIVAIEQSRAFEASLKRLEGLEAHDAWNKLNSRQQYIVLFNRALLLCLMNTNEECLEYIASIWKRYPSHQELSRILAMIALRSTSSTANRAISMLQAESSLLGRLCYAHVQLTKGAFENAARCIDTISSIKHFPGTVATLVNIYEAAGNITAAQTVLDAALEHHKTLGLETEAAARIMEGRCSFLYKTKQFEKAAAAFKDFLNVESMHIDPDTRTQSLASLVICLSYIDPEEAERYCAFLPSCNTTCDADPTALELAAPRSIDRVSHIINLDAKTSKATVKNPERIARKRAKRREAYLAKLRARDDYNATIGLPKPDPERWIPRKQRSYGRRGRRGRTRISGAQGAGNLTEKEAMKLDAAARAAARQQGDAPKSVVVQSQTASLSRKSKKKKRR